MINVRQHVATLLLPALLFGFSAYSNGMLLLKQGASTKATEIMPVSVSGVLDGELTRDLDTVYKKELPHRDYAVGYVGNLRYALLGTGRKGVVVGHEGWLFTNEEFRQVSASHVVDTVKRIGDVSKQLEKEGVKLVMLPVPAKADVYGNELPTTLKADAMSKAYDGFVEALVQSDIAVVDTRSELLSQKASTQVFLKSDTHWSPEGAQLAAKAAALTVSKLGVELEPAKVAVVPSKPVSIWGDLTRFITLPDYAPGIGLQQEQLTLFRTEVQAGEAGLDVFGDAAGTPVLLVGTSYSANENWSFIDYLRQSLSVDVVNVAKEGLGPGVPMMDLLTSKTLSELKPKLVIWEFPVRYLGSKNLWQRSDPKASPHSAAEAKSNV